MEYHLYFQFWNSSPKHQFLYEHLKGLYDGPNRHYHNWDHIEYAQKIAVTLCHDVDLSEQDYLEVQLALFFHDIIHTTTASGHTGEMDSGELAELFLSHLEMEAKSARQINYYIWSTSNHIPVKDTLAEKIVICSDLWGLGGSWPEYVSAGERVRQEYSHLTDEEFRVGRIDFLKKFLDRDRIFPLNTERCDVREQWARINMITELDELTNGQY